MQTSKAEPGLSMRTICLLVWLASAGPMSVYYTRYLRMADWPMLVSGFPIGCDFANMWSGGRAAALGNFSLIFDGQAYAAELARLIHPGFYSTVLVWSYPPTAFWLGLPFAALPYLPALALWTLAGLMACLLAFRLAAPKPVPRWPLPLLVLAPAMIIALYIGQTSLLTAAAFVSGLLLARERPLWAGALLATFVAKPHLGLALPVILLTLGHWRAFAATAGFAALYLLATVLAFGLEPWQLFFEITLPRQMSFLAMAGENLRDMYISPYSMLVSLGASRSAASYVHWCVAAVALAALGWSLPRLRDREIQLTLAAATTMLLSPYMTLYELVLPALAAVRLAAYAPETSGDALVMPRRLMIALCLGAPAIGLAIVYDLNFNPVPLVLIAIAGIGTASAWSSAGDRSTLPWTATRASAASER